MIDIYSVYKHTAPNGKIYIGITKCKPEERWANGAGYKDNRRFWKDILNFGWSNIKHEILFNNLTEMEAKNKECELINQFRSNDVTFGYNQINFVPKEKTTNNKASERRALKTMMVKNGDYNFVSDLARMLNITRNTASSRLSGESNFKQDEIAIISKRYSLTAGEIFDIFIKGIGGE